MKTKAFCPFVISLFLISFLSVNLFAQNSSSPPVYEPEIGQPGKDVVWVPTPLELVDTMLSIAEVTPDDFVIDLGSGDGRLVIKAAKRGACALGIEYNPDLVEISRRSADIEGVSNRAEFIEADLFEYDFSNATVITMFLLPELNIQLRPRLLELKPGTRIVSNTFTMGEWEPDYEVTTPENWNSWNTAYMWIIPAKVEGVWDLGEDQLILSQEFQMIQGRLISGDKETTIRNGRLRGNEITFMIDDILYTGGVSGNKMEGIMKSYNGEKEWVAIR
jgi:SAM-dependent methyltransferase